MPRLSRIGLVVAAATLCLCASYAGKGLRSAPPLPAPAPAETRVAAVSAVAGAAPPAAEPGVPPTAATTAALALPVVHGTHAGVATIAPSTSARPTHGAPLH